MNPNISASMRDVLLDHTDRAIVKTPDPNLCCGRDAAVASAKQQTTKGLLARGLIKPAGWKPGHTVITEAGHRVLINLLNEYVEVLVRAGRKVEELRYFALRASLVDEPREVAEPKDLQEA